MFFEDGARNSDRRILVIEDEYLVATHIALTLEDLGYTVVGPVSTIDEAIAVIGSETLSCALLDANLDGLSSAPIAAELAARHVPFVVVTGYGSLALATAHLDDAPRVTKPFTTGDLATTLDAVCAH